MLESHKSSINKSLHVIGPECERIITTFGTFLVVVVQLTVRDFSFGCTPSLSFIFFRNNKRKWREEESVFGDCRFREGRGASQPQMAWRKSTNVSKNS